MVVVEEGDFEVRSSKLETGLSLNSKSEELDVDIAMSKVLQPSNPSSSSSSPPFYVLSEYCCLKTKQLKSIRKRFQFPRALSLTYLVQMRRLEPLHMARCASTKLPSHVVFAFPSIFIMSLLSSLNLAPGQLVPNA